MDELNVTNENIAVLRLVADSLQQEGHAIKTLIVGYKLLNSEDEQLLHDLRHLWNIVWNTHRRVCDRIEELEVAIADPYECPKCGALTRGTKLRSGRKLDVCNTCRDEQQAELDNDLLDWSSDDGDRP